MKISAQIAKEAYYTNGLFSLAIYNGEINTRIIMELFASRVHTKDIPATSSILQKRLPSIFYSKCFNEKNYPFSQEVKNTEIGHLFEHILLEYLREIKLASGFKNPIYNGLTKWDWERDAVGVFHISIDAGVGDKDIFKKALHKSIELLLEIFHTISPKASSMSLSLQEVYS